MSEKRIDVSIKIDVEGDKCGMHCDRHPIGDVIKCEVFRNDDGNLTALNYDWDKGIVFRCQACLSAEQSADAKKKMSVWGQFVLSEFEDKVRILRYEVDAKDALIAELSKRPTVEALVNMTNANEKSQEVNVELIKALGKTNQAMCNKCELSIHCQLNQCKGYEDNIALIAHAKEVCNGK